MMKPKHTWNETEQKYGTTAKMIIKVDKFYVEDAEGITTIEEDNAPATTLRYGKKVHLRR